MVNSHGSIHLGLTVYSKPDDTTSMDPCGEKGTAGVKWIKTGNGWFLTAKFIAFGDCVMQRNKLPEQAA